MNTRKNIFILSMLLLITSVACEDLVDKTPVSNISSDSFWQTEEDVKAATYGMYNQFRTTFDIKTVIWGEFRTAFYGQGYSTATDWDDLWENNLNTTSVGTNWNYMYLLINDANLIINKAADIPFKSEAEKDHILGQAYFVRAYTYFQIAKLWGDAPIVTEGFESTDQNLEPSRHPKADVFEQVKEDVDMAVSLLGERASVNYIGSTAANMLKADVYLWTAKLENGGNDDLLVAQSAVDQVLSSGHQLESDFTTVFRNESSDEIIFSIFYSELEPGTGNRNGVQNSSGRSQTGTHPSYITLPSPDLTPAELEEVIPVAPSPQWLNLSDYFIDNILKPADVDSRTNTTWMSMTASNDQTATWINKYIGEVVSGTRLPVSDLVIYRFAEAILFKAEIENALGNTGDALNYLNKIAQRAYGVEDHYSGLGKEAIDNAILDERILEFVLEGKSWYDIQRFGQAFQRIPSLIGREGDHNGNILLFPVAQDVINRNTNITQTDGY